ncbi:MAG: hypothetical protein ABJE95_14775 [Byssovorax sp.]
MSMSIRVTLYAVLGLLVVPACEIKIGSGAGGETSVDPAITTGAGGGGTMWTPEQLAAFDAIQHADPIEIAKVTDTAAFAAVTTSNLVAMQQVDPATLDAAMASQLVDSAAPDGINAALAWAQSVDPSLFSAGINPKYECIDPPHNCPPNTKCPQFGGICSVTECSTGSCPYCPELFENLVIDGWCSYGCMKGAEIVGGAFILQTKWGSTPPQCIGK